MHPILYAPPMIQSNIIDTGIARGQAILLAVLVLVLIAVLIAATWKGKRGDPTATWNVSLAVMIPVVLIGGLVLGAGSILLFGQEIAAALGFGDAPAAPAGG